MLQERADISAIGAMTIANRKKVAVFEPHYMRVRYISVLVDFVRVVHRNASFCSK